MSNARPTKIIVFPHRPGTGGPGSFQKRFEVKLKENGWRTEYAKENTSKPDVIFVIGGTRKIFWLLKMKIKRVPIIYRLDGINWLHTKKNVSFGYYLNKSIANGINKCIHAFLADKIIYQSRFVQEWWNKSGWKHVKNAVIIHNGVRIPKEEDVVHALNERKSKRLVVLEGTIDYTPYAIKLLNDLALSLPKDIHIEIYGKFENSSAKKELHDRLQYKGFLEHKNVYDVFKGALYLSLDIHPACPNTVAEALACGAPVVAFKTGALSELVDTSSGIIVDYGSNPWDLGYPDVKGLCSAIIEVFNNYNSFSKNAYQKAKSNFDLTHMFYKYLEVFKG